MTQAGWIAWLAIPLSIGWHPTPTLGTLAETAAVLCAGIAIALARPLSVDWTRVAFGAGGVVALLLARALAQPFVADDAYAAFWLAPAAVLVTALLVGIAWSGRQPHWPHLVATAVLATALINAVIGFAQYWRWESLIAPLAPYWVFWDPTDTVAYGNVAQRNVLASLCLLGMAASAYLFPSAQRSALAVELFLAFVVALTSSRTPLAIAVVVVLLAALHARSWRGATARPVLRFVVPIVACQAIAQPLGEWVHTALGVAPSAGAAARLAGEGLGIRAVFYRLAFDIALAHPWLGVGWKQLPAAMVDLGFARDQWGVDALPTQAHNLFLQLAAETGLILAIVVSAYVVLRLLRAPAAHGAAAYAWLSALILFVHSLFEFPLWHPALLFLFVVFLCELQIDPQRAAPAPRRASGIAVRLAAAAVALGAAVTLLQLADVAALWQRAERGALDAASARAIDRIRANPLLAPYGDWLALQRRDLDAASRLALARRVAAWIPDSGVLAVLADAYRAAGMPREADAVQARRAVVFGVQRR